MLKIIIRVCDDLVFWATNNLPPQSNGINHSQGNYVRVWIYLSCCCSKFMYFVGAVMRTMRVWFIMWWALFATFNHRLCIWHVLWNATLSFMTEVFPANSISFRQGSCTILHVNPNGGIAQVAQIPIFAVCIRANELDGQCTWKLISKTCLMTHVYRGLRIMNVNHWIAIRYFVNWQAQSIELIARIWMLHRFWLNDPLFAVIIEIKQNL